jgi:hypothetical protein
VLVVFGPPPGDGLGQLSDGVQEILGADVIANRAVGHCGVEQRCEGGAGEASPRLVASSAVNRWIPWVSASAGSCAALRAAPALATASIPLSTP